MEVSIVQGVLLIKHSLNNGAVLTMENKVPPNALKLGGFVH